MDIKTIPQYTGAEGVTRARLNQTINDTNSNFNDLNSTKADKITVYTKQETDTKLTEKTGINATATYTNNAITITASVSVQQITFIAPSDFSESDTYTINGTQVTITDLNNEPLSNAWKQGSPVQLILKGNKAFFKSGGGTNDTLPPQIHSFAVTSGNGKNTLSWVLPVDTSAYEGLVVVRKIGSAPTKVSDGTKISLSKTATSYTDTGLTNDTKYYYRAFPYNSKKQYQTELTGAVAYGTPVSFQLPTYKGQHAIFGDETEGRIEMYTSGTLTVSPAIYDLFAVGGGGNGYYAGGGGGGYTNTEKNIEMQGENSVVIGSHNGNTSVTNTTIIIKANSGSNAGADGGAGGSGGGAGARSETYSDGSGFISTGGRGGSDGSNGFDSSSSGKGGTGQGTTTRAFGEATGTLYAGGGGAGAYKTLLSGYSPSSVQSQSGGGGGGGAGGNLGNPGSWGANNTGGGGGDSIIIDALGIATSTNAGAGGSGIAIIRWKRN